MNKMWLLVIILAVVTAVVLAFTWQNIPYLNTWVMNTNTWIMSIDILAPLFDFKTTLEDTVRNNPTQILGVAGGSMTLLLASGRKIISVVNEKRRQATAFSQQTGELANMVNDAKDQVTAITGRKDELIKEVEDLKAELTTQAEQYSDIQAVIDVKDAEITRLRTQTDDLHEVIQRLKLGDGETIEKIVVA